MDDKLTGAHIIAQVTDMIEKDGVKAFDIVVLVLGNSEGNVHTLLHGKVTDVKQIAMHILKCNA